MAKIAHSLLVLSCASFDHKGMIQMMVDISIYKVNEHLF